MRTIKFRAWNYDLNNWVSDEILTDLIFINQIVRPPKTGQFVIDTLNKSNIEISQFTGLHDKNGKEIWEGDIVNVLHCPKRLVVVWDNKYYTFMLQDKVEDYEYAEHLFDTTGEGDYGMNMWEVIGNIYEIECEEVKP